MTDSANYNAIAWGLPGVVKFFDTRRATTDEVYSSEWLFLKDRLIDGVSVLDVGCAQGGFATVLSEHLTDFSYTGLDINSEMITRARQRHPIHTFHHIKEGAFGLAPEEKFDLVLVLGILHLHENWRTTLARAWVHTEHSLIFDLRETDKQSVEDKTQSYFRMDFNTIDQQHTATTLPYNIINSSEALSIVRKVCPDAEKLQRYGYQHPPSSSAMTPLSDILASVYCVER